MWANFFQNSVYIKSLIDSIRNENQEFHSNSVLNKICYPNHYNSTLDLISLIDIDYVKSKLTHKKYPESFSNFMSIIAPLMDQPKPHFSSFWQEAWKEQVGVAKVNFELKMKKIIDDSGIKTYTAKDFNSLIPLGEEIETIEYKFNKVAYKKGM